MLNREWRPEDGEPVRSFNRAHFGRHIVLFPSQKNQKQIICESRHEAAYCIYLETDKDVKSYFLQPVTTEICLGRKKTHYTPDFFVRCHCHEDYFAEVKPSFDVCPHEYLDVLQAFEKIAKKLKYGFQKVDDRQIQQKPKHFNLKTLYLRSLHTSDKQYNYFIEPIRNNLPLTLGELLHQSAAPPMTVVAKAILRGDIWMDLNKPLNLRTLLRLETAL